MACTPHDACYVEKKLMIDAFMHGRGRFEPANGQRSQVAHTTLNWEEPFDSSALT